MRLLILGVGFFTFFIILHSRHKKPLPAAIANMVLGISGLILIAAFIPVSVNIYTVFTALTLSLPGVILVALGTLLL